MASLFVLLAITVVGIDGPAFARYEPTVANDAAQWHDWAFWASSPESLRNLALIVGGFLAATVGLWLAAVRTLAVHRSSKVAEKRQVTEAFTTATGQLGASNDLEVRHGAIYALGELARTAPSMHWPIMETLSAYVREHSRPKRESGEVASEPLGAESEPLELKPDIEAAVGVLCGRVAGQDPPDQRLDLSGSVFPSARMHGVNLKGANLRSIGWVGVDLSDANLSNTDLVSADLRGADLRWTNLKGANLSNATLIGADLNGADLRRADLRGAELREANLIEANLSEAFVVAANLGEANLTGADLRGVTLGMAKFEDTIMPDGMRHSGTGPPPDLDGTD